MMARRWLYLGGAALGLAALLAWAFAPRPLEVEAASVALGRFESAVEEDGKTRLLDQYLVSAPLAGLVSRITLREGDPVAAGSIVAELRPAHAPLLDERTRRQQEARLEGAQAQVAAASAAVARAAIALSRARHDLQRTEQLAQAGFVAASRLDAERLAAQAAERELDSSQAQRQIAVHEVDQARAALAASGSQGRPGSAVFALRAPVAGRVLRVIQTSAAVVGLGAPLLELGDPDRIEVVAELLTTDAVLARPGSPVHIERWGGPSLSGRVRRVEPAGFTKISALGVEEQRVRVLIDMPGAAAQAGLGVGYRVNVRIVTLSRDQVLLVPVSALFPLPGRSGGDAAAMAVYRVIDGRARLTPVRLGGRNDRQAWLLAGLAAGASVIVYPSPEVRDGERVRVRDVSEQR